VVAVVDLHVVLRARAAAVLEAGLLHAAEDGIEVLIRHQEGVVVALEVLAVVEVQREVLVDLHRGEVAEEAGVLQAHDVGYEPSRLLFVLRRDNGVIQVDSHRVLLRVLFNLVQ
jgi:hypothetical protein